ncbi:condensation domain-containing protein, partial [Mycolicibacterium sp. BiH015]|uniref:condensation domain-containing protein n=1 Tax=Mycolicibacterium sp. BiH015 TaxID=3018808 RepID=UPI0022E3D47B
DEHILVAVVHHIAADGWSITPLVTDLSTAYTARTTGHPPTWAPLPVQYADYTLWQRQLLGELTDPTSAITAQLHYWEHALADLPEHLTLPTDRPYPPTANHHGATLPISWPPHLHQAITQLARNHNATPFMVVHTALAILLSKLSATTDIPIGFPIAGRRDPTLDHLVGFFVNTLILRTDTSTNPTTTDLLTQTRTRALAAYEHQDIPFEALVEHLNPTRNLTHHPLIQIMLGWNNVPGWAGNEFAFGLGDVEVTPLPVGTDTARVDLSLSLAETFTAAG